MAKSKYTRYVSPAGTAVYPWLNKPDTKFNPEGEYRTKLNIKTDYKGFVAQLNDLHEKALAKAKEDNPGKKIKAGNLPYAEEDDGSITLSFKLKAKVTPKHGEPFEQKVALFDAKGRPTKANVGGGSTIKVAFEAIPYYTAIAGAGVSLRIRAAQVIDLVEYGSKADGSSFGFGEEDGYEASDEDDTNDTPFDTDAAEETNEEEF